MGKNKKSNIEILDPNLNELIHLDSLEEWQIYNWVLELCKLGVIKSYEYQPTEFQLSQSILYVPLYDNPKNKSKSLLRSHEYTADFKIEFYETYGKLLSQYFKIDKSMLDNDILTIYIDVKGTFQRNGGDRSFSINQKIVYDKFGIYVQKVVPQDLFKTLGIPIRCLKGYKGKPSKIFNGYNFAKTIFSSSQPTTQCLT